MKMSQDSLVPGWFNFQGKQSLSLTSKPVKLTTNLYEIRTDKLMSAFYKYEFLPSQAGTKNQMQLIYRNMKEQRVQFEKRIDFICDFKDGFLGIKRVDGIMDLLDQANHSLHLKIKLVENFTLDDILKEDCKQTVLKHLIEPVVRKCIQNSERNIKKDHIGNHKIEIIPNFEFSFVEMKKKMYLTTNITFGIKDDYNVLTYMEKYNDQASHKKLLINREVIEDYGQRNRYVVVDIDYSKTPQSKHHFENKEYSFTQYYKERHILNIVNQSQNLLIVNRLGKEEKNLEKNYLVPQLVSLYNSVNPVDMNQHMIEKIQKKKWQLPQEKEIYALRIIKQLGENQIVKKSALNFEGMILKPPQIKIDSRFIYPEQGIFSFRGKIFKAAQIKNWGLVYIQGAQDKQSNNDISKLVFFMKAAGNDYGIKIANEPGLINVKGDISQWKNAIQSDIQRFGLPQILVFFLRQEQMSYYSQLMQYIVMELKCPCQIIRRNSITTQTKKPFSVASEILIQIQSKIGGIPWEIVSNTQLSQRKLMCGGIHLSKDKDGYSISLVGSINPQGTQFYSFNKRKYPKQTDINFELLFIHWAKNYVMLNKFSPDTIIIYRSSNQEVTQRSQISFEFNQIKSAIKKIGQKTKIANYNPNIAYLSLYQSNNVEIYSSGQNEQKDMIIQNPDAGTAVVEKNSDESCSFYLNALRDVDRTTSPSKYVIYENMGIGIENLINYTYEQCYNYYSYKGAVKNPAFVQYARKLANFSEKTSVEVGYEDRMTKILYFL